MALKVPGETAGPVVVDGRFHILKLVEVHESAVRPLAEADISVRRRLAQLAQARDVEAFLEKLRKQIRVDVYEANVGKAEVKRLGSPPVAADASSRSPAAANGKLAERQKPKEVDDAARALVPRVP